MTAEPCAVPESPEVVDARALARIAERVAAQPEPLTATPPDVAMAIAIAPRHRRPALGIRLATALHVPEEAPPPDTCDPSPRAATCAVEVIFAHPVGHSHRVPPASTAPVTATDVLASLDLCRAACERMSRRTATRERSPTRATVASLPDVPELVHGADAAARRVALDRMAALIRDAGELAEAIEAAPAPVAARARAALARLIRPGLVESL